MYRSNSEHESLVQNFARDFKRRQTDRTLEFLDLNTRDGAAMASLYDIVQYPAILALNEEGQLLKAWIGDRLPLMDEVAYYVQS